MSNIRKQVERSSFGTKSAAAARRSVSDTTAKRLLTRGQDKVDQKNRPR